MAVVVGEPGSGKSRLLAELAGIVGWTNEISIAGYEPERHVPLACARALLARLDAESDGDVLGKLIVRDRIDAAPVEQMRVFEAAHRVVATLSPLLLRADDAHWADDTSLALVHYLCRSAFADRRPVMVALAARPSSRVVDVIAAYRRTLGSERVRVIELGPLDRDDGILLARQLEPELDDRSAAALWQSSGGSPFWLEVLVSGEDGGSVGKLIGESVRSLSADGAALISLLAIAGRPMLFEDVVDVQGWAAKRVNDAASELELRGLAPTRGRPAGSRP